MPLPLQIAVALERTGLAESAFERGLIYADGKACEGAKYHSPTPLVLYEDKIAGRTVTLCATCKDNMQVYCDLLDVHPEGLPWPLRREFGNLIRALAVQKWGTDER